MSNLGVAPARGEYPRNQMVAERLQATRLQLLDMYSPVAARAGA